MKQAFPITDTKGMQHSLHLQDSPGATLRGSQPCFSGGNAHVHELSTYTELQSMLRACGMLPLPNKDAFVISASKDVVLPRIMLPDNHSIDAYFDHGICLGACQFQKALLQLISGDVLSDSYWHGRKGCSPGRCGSSPAQSGVHRPYPTHQAPYSAFTVPAAPLSNTDRASDPRARWPRA